MFSRSVATRLLAVLWVPILLASGVAFAQTTAPAASPIASIPQPTSENYYVFPIRCPFVPGLSEQFANALMAAKAAKAKHIVIGLDTPGGLVSELQAMIDLMGSHPEFHYIAVVINAGSAGAVLALACPDVLMTPNGVMGAAAVMSGNHEVYDPSTRRRVSVSKMKAESFYHAKVRAAVEAAGHDLALARAMMEPDLDIVAVTMDGKTRFVEVGERQKIARLKGGDGDIAKRAEVKTIKNRGEVLSLAAQEALALGVANAILPSVQRRTVNDVWFKPEEVGPALALPNWRPVGSAEVMMRKFVANYLRQSYLNDHKQQIDSLDARIKQLDERRKSLADSIAAMTGRPGAGDSIASLRQQELEVNRELSKARAEKKKTLDAVPQSFVGH